MVRWRKVVLSILPAIFLFIGVPFLILAYFGVTTEALLAVIFYLEVLIILMQADIMQREIVLAKAGFMPVLRIHVEEYSAKSLPYIRIILQNIGEYVAYNILVIIRQNGKPVKAEKPFIQTLSPSDELIILSRLRKEDFVKSEISIEILCNSVIGEEEDIFFQKPKGSLDFIYSVPRKAREGIILPQIENLRLAISLLTLSRGMKKTKIPVERFKY